MSRGTLDPAGLRRTSDTGLSPSLAGCSKAVLLSFADPTMQSEPRNARIPVWALPRSLAATDGIDISFSSSGYLDVSVPRVALQQLWIHRWMAGFFSCRVPPFGHLRLFAPLTAPRSFSQFGTSFFTFEWQGILRTPFLT